MQGKRVSDTEITRDNHYVAQWYQRGFLAPGQAQLKYLDLTPDQKTLPDGRVITMRAMTQRGPKACFYQSDLYSTHFGQVVSDDIEKLLFGPIDDRGAIAVRAVIEGELSGMHHTFKDFFEYIDAQRLRTPKGLDWIKSRYSNLDQHRLMREMQAVRLMNTTMWMEGVREIVSAEYSDVKFIISDHPVSVFNSTCAPNAAECAYPEDPPLEWIGSITVFPLDANTCIIFSHLEYAQNQKKEDLRRPRTDARYRGHGLARTDAFIRERKLSREEVLRINYLLKSRSRRFIAAGNGDWLFPEREVRCSWQDIAATLLPKDDLWKFGGEVFVGYKDGSTHYQDAFGRTSRSHEWLKREGPRPNPGANDECGCGSGKKYKKCCMDIPDEERPSWTVLSIRERNLILCRALRGILGMADGKSWVDVRREISDEQVVRIYELFQGLWPEDTDLTELLPRPRRNVFRSLYLGVADPQTVEPVALGWLPYFDEVVIASPFANPIRMRPEFSPIKSPSQHKAQTLRNAAFMFMVEAYINAGLVHVVPDIGDFNPDFGASTMRLAEQRARDLKTPRGSFGLLERLKRAEFQRMMFLQPEDSLRASIRKNWPDASQEEVDSVVAHSRLMAEADPLAMLQPLGRDKASSQLMSIKGYNLESGLYIASMTGACIHTDARAHWDQIHEHAIHPDSSTGWQRTSEHLADVRFPVQTDSMALWSDIDKGHFGYLRAPLRRLSEFVRESETAERDEQLAVQIDTASRRLASERSYQGSAAALAASLRLSAPTSGFHRDEVQRLLFSFGKARTPGTVPFALFMDFGLPDVAKELT